MRSASANTASMSCSISRMVSSRLSSRSVSTMRADLLRPHARPSARRAAACAGAVASAIAISSWRCSPWLRLATSDVGAAGEADARERRARRLAQLGLAARVAPEAEGVAGMRLHRERDVVERGEIEEQRGDLERAREPELAAAVGRQRGDVVAVETDAAGVGRDLAGELADQRGLAGAVRADDGVQLARRHVERDVVGGDDAAEALAQAVDLQQRLSHGAPSPAGRRCRRARTARPAAASARGSICQYSRAVAMSLAGEEAATGRSRRAAPPPAAAARPRRSPGRTPLPMPPSTAMTMRSPERVQCIIAGLMKSVWLASSTPARPQMRAGDDEADELVADRSESRSRACAARSSARPGSPGRSAS